MGMANFVRGSSHEVDHAVVGKRLTEGLLNMWLKKMPAGLRTFFPFGRVLPADQGR